MRVRTRSTSSLNAAMSLGSSTRIARNSSSLPQSLGGCARVRRRRPTRLAVGRRRKVRNSFCRRAIIATLPWLYAQRMTTSTSDFSSEPGSAETLRRLRNSSGMLATAAVRRLDEELTWFKELEAENRSWVGLVAQAGISAFISWFENPTSPGQATDQIFAAAPPELTRSISLQNTLQLVRVVVEVVEEHTDQLAAADNKAHLREAVLRYSREVAFSAAEVYARAAEVRGAWDARLEALVVDAIVRGDTQESLGSRMSALGWSGHGGTLVIIGHTPVDVDGPYTADLRRAARRAADDALVGIQGDRLVLVLGGTGDLRTARSEERRVGKERRSAR